MTVVPLFLFAFLVSSPEMDGKAERRLGTSPCDNEVTIALRTNALRAYEGKSSELIPPDPRSRVGTYCIQVSSTWYTSIALAFVIAWCRAGYWLAQTAQYLRKCLRQQPVFYTPTVHCCRRSHEPSPPPGS